MSEFSQHRKMDKKIEEALLSLLKDPDKKTFEAVSESLMSHSDIIPVLETLWKQADDETVVSRLNVMLRHARIKKLSENLGNWKAGGATDVLEGAWLAATYQYHELVFADITSRLAGPIKDVWLELREDQEPAVKVAELNRILFTDYQLKGDTSNLNTLHNFFIHNVLQSKKGNDITLAIIYMGVAQAMHIPIYGVRLPHNFILAYMDESDMSETNILEKNVIFYINPFNEGVVFTEEEIKHFIRKQQIPFDPAFLRPCSNLATIERLISGMQTLFDRKGLEDRVNDMNMLLQTLRGDVI